MRIYLPADCHSLGQVLFPEQANGSLVKQDGKVIGSKAHWTTMDRT